MRRLKKQIKGMPFPVPFTVERLASAVGEQMGQHIELVEIDPPRSTDLRTACGLRAELGDTTYILYRRRPTASQMDHIVLHELAHVWLRHGTLVETIHTPIPEALLSTVTRGRLAPEALLQQKARFLPVEDRAAELAAALIQDTVRRLPLDVDPVSTLDALLSHPFEPTLWRPGAVPCDLSRPGSPGRP